MKEIWKDIPGYKGYYQISNLGRARSLDRITPHGRKLKGKFLKPDVITGGYYRISLCKNNVRKNYLISRLVAGNFIPNPNNLPEVNHINEIKSDNGESNLEWCDHKQNNDLFRKGKNAIKRDLNANSNRKGKGKLDESEAIIIKKLRQEFNIKYSTIADLFNINELNVKHIVSGRTWKHLPNFNKEKING